MDSEDEGVAIVGGGFVVKQMWQLDHKARSSRVSDE
jgi:hypothetical protein